MTNYSVEDMKAEEKELERAFKLNPNLHADMIVSFDKEETKRIKSFYFK